MKTYDQRLRERIERLSYEMRNHPRRHVLRIVIYILLGYFWPVILLAVCLLTAVIIFPVDWGRLGVFVWLLIFGGIGTAVFVALRGIGLSQSAPWGMTLSPQEAPDLFRMIEDVRAVTGGPRIHEVRLDWRMNAAIVRVRGKLPWKKSRNALVVGVALLAALSREDIESVLAHEMGHLQSNADPFGGWVYRVVAAWQAITRSETGKRTCGAMLFGWFASRYVPWIAATTIPARREHEFRADSVSAKAFGCGRTARALVRTDWASYRIGRAFTVSIWHETAQRELPPDDYVQRIFGFLNMPVDEAVTRAWRERERNRKGHVTEEHPTLCARLTALNAPEALDLPSVWSIDTDSSALALLGAAKDRAIRYANTSWKASVIANWRNEHQMAQYLAKEAKQSDESGNSSPAAKRWVEVQTDVQYRDPIMARPLLEEFLAAHGDHAEANYDLGRMMLNEDDDRGIAYMERAMECSTNYVYACLYALLEHYRATGRDAEADEIIRRIKAFEKTVSAHRKHAARLRKREELQPHGLAGRKLREVQLMVGRFPQVSRVYLVRRSSQVFADKPVYVVAVVASGLRRIESRFLRAMEQAMPLDCTVVTLPWWKTSLRRRVMAACPEPIFEHL